MPTDDALITEERFARTYDGGDYADAYAVVQQYRRAVTHSVDNPETQTATIAAAADAPRGRVETWLTDGAVPAVMQGLYTAHEQGWIGVTYDDLTALNVLVANVYSGGTISETYAPEFTLNKDGLDATVVTALELAGVGYQELDSGSPNSRTVAPAEDGLALGRVLAVLGAPVGRKSQREEFSLPWYLADAPGAVRKRFVDSYLENRAQTDPTTDSVQIQEDRPQSYLDGLADLIESVAGEAVSASDQSVTLSAPAARVLGYERDG